jgi:hypothetical protein
MPNVSGPLMPNVRSKMKNSHILFIFFVSIAVLSCKNEQPKTLSASAIATRNAYGEIVVREATKKEVYSLDKGLEKIQKINSKYPAPPTPLNQETYAVKSITEEGVFILENNQHIRLSGIKCGSAGVYFIRKFFNEDTERIAYLAEKEIPNGPLYSYVWLVDSSLINDPGMKKYGIGPFFSAVNDMVILNNWCKIDPGSGSKYLSRYKALEKISRKSGR